MTDFAWTDPRVDLLKARWATGYSASDIAVELRADIPVESDEILSRSAVLGKLNRLGLCEKRSQRAPKAAYKPARPPRVARRRPFSPPPVQLNTRATAAPAPAAEPLRAIWNQCSVLELSDDRCKWPCACNAGDPGFHFCGGPPVEGRAYCEAHCRIAYQRRPGEREAA